MVWSFDRRAVRDRHKVDYPIEPVVSAYWRRKRPAFFLGIKRRLEVASYIALVNFTDQGGRQIRQSTERAKALMNAAANLGIRIQGHHWTLGALDAVIVAA